jgi:hypothetical protein
MPLIHLIIILVVVGSSALAYQTNRISHRMRPCSPRSAHSASDPILVLFGLPKPAR